MESLEVLLTWDEDRHQPETSVMESLLFGIQQSQPRSSQRRWNTRLNDLWVIISLIRLRVGVIPCVSSLIESKAIQGRLIPLIVHVFHRDDRVMLFHVHLLLLSPGAFVIMTNDHDHKRLEEQVNLVNLIKLICLYLFEIRR